MNGFVPGSTTRKRLRIVALMGWNKLVNSITDVFYIYAFCSVHFIYYKSLLCK